MKITKKQLALGATIAFLGALIGACGGSDAEEAQSQASAGSEQAQNQVNQDMQATQQASEQAAAEAAAQAQATQEAAQKAASEQAAAAEAAAKPAQSDVVDTAMANPQFSTLAKAIQAAGLVDTLRGAGPYTVFAPTDEAFNKLPKGKLDELMKPENKEKLAALLQYHVVSGQVNAADVAALKTAKTVGGKNIKISAKNAEVKLNNSATVVSTDIQCSNGVIHVIDTVLMPKK